MIESAHIRSLTASKITAGTINAHEIILKQQGPQTVINAPANMAIIRSSDYNGSYSANSTPNWTNGTSGWIIAGDGHAEFSSASIRGTVKAGSIFINQYNRWKTDANGLEMSTPYFGVGDANNYAVYDGVGTFAIKGTVTATSGKIAGWYIIGNELQAGDFSGSMRIGGEVGPIPPAGGFVTGTGAVSIYAPTAAGKAMIANYNGYGATYYFQEVLSPGAAPTVQYKFIIDPLRGIAYRPSENNFFSFRVSGGQVYIRISTEGNPDGVEYPLCIRSTCDGVSSPGGGGGGCTCTGPWINTGTYCDPGTGYLGPLCTFTYQLDSCGNVCTDTWCQCSFGGF